MRDHAPPEPVADTRAHSTRPPLRISLFDGIALHVGHREVPLNNRKARALIAYLATTPGMRESRDRLVGLLWSEAEDGRARASLRTLLHGLRDALEKEGVGALSADNFHVSLEATLVTTDLDSALASIDEGAPADRLMSEPPIADAFLRGYDDIDPSFGNWLAIRRENVRRLLIRRLETQLSARTDHSEATKRIAHALFQIEPTHEIACQRLMRCCIAAGNTAGALAVYKQLWTCLEEEYDIEPSAATQELVVAIRNGTYQAPAVSFEAHSSIASLEHLDSVVLLAVKLAMAWATKPESSAPLDASAVMRLG